MNKLKEWLSRDWQRKVVSLLAGIMAWYLINQSIIETKTLSGIPIRIANLPSNKTIEGLLPNGILNRRVTLTLSGTKRVIENLGPDDLEVILDAEDAPNEWVVQILRKNLISLNPKINLQDNITSVDHADFVIKLTRLITSQLPITIEQPTGTLPRSYLYLGVWPEKLTQSVSGPEEMVEKLKIEGLELRFNLDDITKTELKELKTPKRGNYSKDVVAYKVPENWKRIYIPFMPHPWQAVNDPNADDLWIEFLRKEFIPLKKNLTVRVFYPIETSDKINPKTHSLATNDFVIEKNGLYILDVPLYAYEVSQLFVDIVRHYMEISIVARPGVKGDELKWSVEFLEPQILEDRYVAFLINQYRENSPDSPPATRFQIEIWRNRFRSFMQNITLYLSPTHRLDLNSYIDDGHIVVEKSK